MPRWTAGKVNGGGGAKGPVCLVLVGGPAYHKELYGKAGKGSPAGLLRCQLKLGVAPPPAVAGWVVALMACPRLARSPPHPWPAHPGAGLSPRGGHGAWPGAQGRGTPLG